MTMLMLLMVITIIAMIIFQNVYYEEVSIVVMRLKKIILKTYQV